MDTFKPIISIVIPVFNAEKYLQDSLDSVINQTFNNFECIIVNGGSTDKSQEIIDAYKKKDRRLKCLNVQNFGSGSIHRSIGINNSNCEFIFSLDADDSISLDCLEKMYLRQYETNADIILQQTIGCNEELKGEIWTLPLPGFNINSIFTGKEGCLLTIGNWQISCAGMLVRKNLFKHVPFTALMNADDLNSRYLLYNANSIAFVNTKYYYRNNTDSISRAISVRIFERLTVDSQLDEFVRVSYAENTGAPIRIRNTRLFNLIYLQVEFIKHFWAFTSSQRSEIREIIKQAYKTQNIPLLRKELPIQFDFVFLRSFILFKINAVIYAFVKKASGSNYILK